jgi:hypothetical protein
MTSNKKRVFSLHYFNVTIIGNQQKFSRMNHLMFWKLMSALLLVVVSAAAMGLVEARLLQQSTTGQTALFNLGLHEGVQDGDFAVIIKQVKSANARDLRQLPVAKARIIKVNPDSSIWILYHIYQPQLLRKGAKYLILSQSTLLQGRREPVVGRSVVVAPRNKVPEAVNDTLKENDDRLAKLKHKYEDVALLHDKDYKSENDFDLVDIEVWEKANKQRYRTAFYNSPHEEDFKRRLRLVTFEKLVTAYLNKVNDPDFNYDAFYEEQKRTAFSNEFRVRSNFNSEYESFLKDQSSKVTADAKLHRSLLEKGDSWSEDYSDEELRRTLNEVSVLQEKDRRVFVMAKPNRYSVALDYGTFLNDAQSETDSFHRRDSRYTIDASFEVIPFLKHVTLERFTLDGSFRIGRNAFEVDGFNADLNEYSLAFGANWYPLYSPYAVESPVVFLGSYIRSGFAAADSPGANQKANYTVLAVPGFRLGLKYILRNNVGLRIVTSMETLKLERYESSSFTPVFPEETNLVEAKVGFGMAYSF